ncbi:hypothetical protein Pla52o_43340 [Novipirellula galeiformis]|uniref:Uncharacterized protein n=1 Tax=Novipirellula galeiformis TaxID=2528004 RepID=A0A5C6CAQ0_9BACT|nr:hypothetical protein [Novipirellula galeiformis]TWU20456.1 hypothetical protein Pla52o_43340 [Novipirellula galeiformis]
MATLDGNARWQRSMATLGHLDCFRTQESRDSGATSASMRRSPSVCVDNTSDQTINDSEINDSNIQRLRLTATGNVGVVPPIEVPEMPATVTAHRPASTQTPTRRKPGLANLDD